MEQHKTKILKRLSHLYFLCHSFLMPPLQVAMIFLPEFLLLFSYQNTHHVRKVPETEKYQDKKKRKTTPSKTKQKNKR